jgi:transcriptional regulator with XRE-family HTH domain
MTEVESESRSEDFVNSQKERQRSTILNSRTSLVQRLRRGHKERAKFVDSHISKGLAFQTRSLRDREGWSQQELADKIGSNQNAIYRAENPGYGKQTLTTLKKIAAAFDVALIVRFVPFSELIDWVSGTPRVIRGLTSSSLEVESFDAEEKTGGFRRKTLDLLSSGAEQSGQPQPRSQTIQDASDEAGRAAEVWTDQRRIPPHLGAQEMERPLRG